MKILLTTLGGYGDSLMLSMFAKRIKELYPECSISVLGRKDTIHILDKNPNIDEIGVRYDFNDIPVLSNRFDAIIDSRYGVKTFYLKEPFDFDLTYDEILARQKETELDLWVCDIIQYRAKLWVQNLQMLYDTNYFGDKETVNWYHIISYLSGINFTPNDLYIHQEGMTLPFEKGNYIAVSNMNDNRGYSKIYPPVHLNKVISAFPNENFIILGSHKNHLIAGKENIVNLENKLNIFQTAYVIANSKFLLSDEGGLVHIAKAVKKKSIVLFGSTQKWLFGYKDNINLTGDYNDCLYCHNQHPYWNMFCKLNGSRLYCKKLVSLNPEIVIQEIEKLLSSKKYPPTNNRTGAKIKQSELDYWL